MYEDSVKPIIVRFAIEDAVLRSQLRISRHEENLSHSPQATKGMLLLSLHKLQWCAVISFSPIIAAYQRQFLSPKRVLLSYVVTSAHHMIVCEPHIYGQDPSAVQERTTKN